MTSVPPACPTAWTGDHLDRETLAEKWTQQLERTTQGVFVIDAPWGAGKTWFAKNWRQALSEKKAYKALYIDAFKNDYLEDPFLLIVAEIYKEIAGDAGFSSKFLEQASKVARAVLPLAAGLSIDLMGRLLIGRSDLSGTLNDTAITLKDTTKATVEAFLADKLKSYTEERSSFDAFQKTLQEFAQNQKKPLLIFMDELDRCKPSFAVQLLERIKHLFDVPNLIFILVINKEQLTRAINGVYGSEVDSSAYLHKFIDLTLSLPQKDESAEYTGAIHIQKLLQALPSKYEVYKQEKVTHLFKLLAGLFDLSLRDMERIKFLLERIEPRNQNLLLTVYLAVLKIKYPNIFDQFLQNKTTAHKDMEQKLQKMKEAHGKFTLNSRVMTEERQGLYASLVQIHRAGKTNFSDSDDLQNNIVLTTPAHYLPPSASFDNACASIGSLKD